VLGDLFQQYAAKYLGVGRGIPLSNTNQLWGLAWGALVFGELSTRGSGPRIMIVAGSLVMVLGAAAIASAVPPVDEQLSWRAAVERECRRYGLREEEALRSQQGEDTLARRTRTTRVWDAPIVLAAAAIFIWLATAARRQPLAVNTAWMAALVAVMLAILLAGGILLWKRTRFC
jgi:glucose uptake protein GlcU